MARAIMTFCLFDPVKLYKKEITYKEVMELTGYSKATVASIKRRKTFMKEYGVYLLDHDTKLSEFRKLASEYTIDDELWKPIKGFSDYKISTYGRIKSYVNGNETFLIPYINRAGYLAIRLKKQGKIYAFPIHRLVAENFLYKATHKDYLRRTLDEMSCVAHIDGDIFNNAAHNLVWISKKDLHKVRKKTTVPVVRIDTVTKDKVFYDSLKDAGEENFITPQAISCCTRGLTATSGGYMWCRPTVEELLTIQQ